jgi:tetratricopeptide (TPR) repeat protein
MAQVGGTGGAREHVTISHAGYSRPWAVWIAHQLEEMGRPTTLLRWDPPAGRPLAEALGGLRAAPGRVLIVLDDWYFALGPGGDAEWAAALGELGTADDGRFAAVSVATRLLPAAALPLRPVDLRDLDEPEARRRILRRLEIDPTAAPPDEGGSPGPRFPNDPPEVWNVPHRSVRFTGRDAVLAEVHRRLEKGGRDGVRLALRGMSGVGKSQIATEYAHRFGNHYDIVWWINAGYRATAREQLADLAPHLGLPTGKEIGNRIRAVHDALRVGRHSRRWLIVFDSADDLEQIEDLLPQGSGHVLITSLTRDWAISGDAVEIEVEAFSRGESIAYARRRAERLTDDEADALAEAVQDLPLLLSQTAAELAASAMPAREYIELIRRGDANRIGIRISSDYPMGFATMWSITLNTLQDKNPEAVELLHLFGLFAPDAIPVRLMQSARPATLPEHLSALAADPIRWHTALRRLSEASTVRMDYAEGADTEPYVDRVIMHRVYHRFLRSNFTEERRATLSAAAARVLADADPRRPTDTRSWSGYAELIPHLEPTGALDSTDPEVRQLILNCVSYLRIRGENRTGLRLCEQVLDRWRPRMAFDQRELRVLVHQHTNMLRRLGRYREALEIGRDTVARLSAVRGPDHPDLLLAKNGLGATLVALGRYQEAYQLFDDSARAFAASLGEESPRTLQDRSNLAQVLALLGRYREAADLDRATLLVRERVLKPRHPLTLETATRYARSLRLLGQYPEATSRAELNVRVLRQVMDRYTPQTLLAEHNLAMCLRRAGDHSTSLSLMRSVVDRFLQHSGPMTPDTLVVQTDYATILRQHGDFDRARESSATVADRWGELLGADHPFAIGTAGNVGLVLWSFGEREAALAIAERARTGMTDAVGPDHPWTVGCVLNASGARHFAGDDEGALDLSRTALAGARAALGEHHPLTLSCKAALADDLRATRHDQAADALEAEVLGQLTDTLGDRHPHTLAMRRRKRPYWEFEPHPT